MNRFEWLREKAKGYNRIVDVGCADAATWRKTPLYRRIVFVDLDLYNHPQFIRADAAYLPFKDNSYQAVVLGEILEHVPDPVKVLSEAIRIASDRVLITVPDEENWAHEYKPYKPIEEVLSEEGLSREQHAIKSNPTAIEFHTDDNYSHLHHNRYYTRKLLREHLELAGARGRYYIENLRYNGWSFFCVEVYTMEGED